MEIYLYIFNLVNYFWLLDDLIILDYNLTGLETTYEVLDGGLD